jgi:hypothetical protein
VFSDKETFPSGEKRSESGVAQRMQTKSAVAPVVTSFDIATSKWIHPGAREKNDNVPSLRIDVRQVRGVKRLECAVTEAAVPALCRCPRATVRFRGKTDTAIESLNRFALSELPDILGD